MRTLDVHRIEWCAESKRWVYETATRVKWISALWAREFGLTRRSSKTRVLRAIQRFEGAPRARLVRFGKTKVVVLTT